MHESGQLGATNGAASATQWSIINILLLHIGITLHAWKD